MQKGSNEFDVIYITSTVNYTQYHSKELSLYTNKVFVYCVTFTIKHLLVLSVVS